MGKDVELIPGAKYTKTQYTMNTKHGLEEVYIRTYYSPDENGIPRPISEYVPKSKVPDWER